MKNANGYGSVIKLGGRRRKKYAVRLTVGWTEEGKQVFKYLGTYVTSKEAKAALASYHAAPVNLNALGITFDELYEEWSKRKFEKVSSSAVNSYRVAYGKCGDLHDMKFSDLRKTHLQKIVDAQGSVSTKKQVKNLFGQLYSYALENDVMHKDYSKYIEIAAEPVSTEKSTFCDEEIRTLWVNLWKVRNADVALILMYTGMRINELFNLKKENVFLEERYIFGGSKTRAGKDRIIPICEKIVPIIEYHLAANDSEWLIVNTRGNQVKYHTFIKRQWDVTMAKLGMAHTPHETRHTFVSNLDRKKVNQITIKKIVGHADSNVTERYTHKNLPEMLEAVNLL